MVIKHFMKLYNKEHEIIDELYLFSDISYTKTLNGIGKMEFKIPIRYLSEKEIELILGQHIELYMIVKGVEHLLWFGVVNSPAPSSNDINCLCLGYACLLQNRNFTEIELNEDNEWKKTYYSKKYGDLIFSLINYINTINFTGIQTGILKETVLETDRVINWNDDLYDKIQEFIEDSNCYFTIDKDRKFNFYNEIGEDKSEYYEINDYNIIGSWDYSIDQTEIFNVVNARVVYKEGDITTVLMSSKKDDESIKLYGYREKALSVNNVKLQETLDKQVEEELNRYKEPLISCNCEIGINDTFNIFDIDVGDYIKLNSEVNNINVKIRVLEYKVDLKKNTVKISLGNAIFRENKPKIYRY